MHHDPHTEEEHSQLILTLKRAIVAEFDSGDWKELGYLTGAAATINNHPRLLRSLDWRDDDYDGCVFDMLELLMQRKPENKDTILGVDKIRVWIKKNEPSIYRELYQDGSYVPQITPKSISPRKSVETALKDAEALIHSSGPVSAVDRVHTALHGFLIALCDKHGVTYSSDPSVTEVYKLLRRDVPALRNMDAHGEGLNKIVKAMATILDALNAIRNRGSVAHPTKFLVSEVEAILAINAARTIFYYLDTRL